MTRFAFAVAWLALWAAVLLFAVLPARPPIPAPPSGYTAVEVAP